MTAIDLFCGGGGVSLGLAELGLRPIGLDYDADSCRTHQAAGHPTIRTDLTDPPTLRGADFVWASPPCTAFSVAGHGHGTGHVDRLIDCLSRGDLAPWPGVDPAVWLIIPTLRAILEVLARLADQGIVVDLALTSPPFLGLRSYLDDDDRHHRGRPVTAVAVTPEAAITKGNQP